MCGIFGYFIKKGEAPDSTVLQAMGKILEHRGPDDASFYSDKDCAVGNMRLAILDIAGGKQPFLSENNQIIVVQNGEIFNYIELKNKLKKYGVVFKTQSDTEVILRLYEHYGIDFLKYLNGMFSIAIYDKKKSLLFLARDRVGIKPLYIYEDDKKILFASEIKSLLSAGIKREVNYEALHHFLSFNYVPSNYTFFKNVRSVLPANYLKITKEKTEEKQWWDLISIQTEQRSEESWITEFNETLNSAVGLRLRCDVPYGAFLSGGIDSSTIVALMSAHSEKPIKTYAIGFEEANFDESFYAQTIANKFQTEHTLEKVNSSILELWPLVSYYCDQPHGDVSFMPTYCVAKLASKNVKVVLTGDGGDELFAGYDRYINFFSDPNINQYTQEQFSRSYFSSINLFSDSNKKLIYNNKMLEYTKNIDSFGIILSPLLKKVESMDKINQVLYADTFLLLAGNNLVKPDRMGMAVSIEARTPFLDVRMMELAFRMPGSLKIKNGQTKYIYKKAVENLIGHDISYRKKQMFTVPIGEWFKNKLQVFMEEILLSPISIKRNLFDSEQIRLIINQHCSGKKNYTREIRALISIEIWFRQFIDNFYEKPTSFSELGINTILC